MNDTSSQTDRRAIGERQGLLLLLLCCVMLALLVRTAWQADDAYTAWRLVDNFVHGYGLRNNIAERVQTFTSTSWTMLNAGVYWLTGNIYCTSIALSLLCTMSALLLAVRRHRDNVAAVLFAFLVPGLSLAFMDFSVGGFENPLSHLVFAVFVTTWFGCADPVRRLRLLFLIAAIAGLTRLDTLAICLPALIVEFARSPVPLGRRLRLVTLSLAPLLLWHLFALVYFGFPLQNAAYAKRFNGIPTSEFVRAGLDFYLNSIFRDPLTLTTVALSTVVCWQSRDTKLRMLAAGVLFYLAYVLYVGGCYMSGRFFSLPLFVSVLLLLESRVLANASIGRTVLPALIVLGCLGVQPTFTTGKDYGANRERSSTSEWLDKGIADERASWYQHSGLLHASRNTTLPRPMPEWNFREVLAQWIASRGDKPLVGIMAPAGYFAYFAPREAHLYDLNGQVDPLMGRLPIRLEDGWKQAHHFREPVPGYQETLESGENQIVDPDLREYYEKIKLITRGDIWSMKRFRTILAMNLGRYNHLLRSYETRSRAAATKGR